MVDRLQRLRYLLLQSRNGTDPMRGHEVECFADALACDRDRIAVFDLLAGAPSEVELAAADVVLLGGSGDHSVSKGGPWLEPALDVMRELHARSKPTFASCWGFQAMAAALGGEVVLDRSRAEVGTCEVELTGAGRGDPVFGPLGERFDAQMGHEDIVDSLPPDAVHLARSPRVDNEAFRFESKPIYCTQFHPELTRDRLLDRLRHYGRYLEEIVGSCYEEFRHTVRETPETQTLMRRFIAEVFG